ncbi:hypothetical protein GYMLUDRAFT_89303 [Collybiopsis luxurians FD-317 M1]|uniref:Uncharacterized protein n=1 Tax=Collybiopsis luxurians FD-317 M1 TaxID=944289 RepID=A0A0D0B895_9AGAR|nr:hypothetical protein GYMLUDRAFT_89303 [Collybiopsis luxurians FD-317 M1]
MAPRPGVSESNFYSSSAPHVRTDSISKTSYYPLQEAEEHPEDLPDLEYGHSYPPSAFAPSRYSPSHNRAREGYTIILGCFLAAGLVAAINHVIFSRLNGSLTGDQTRQFWISVVRNIFPTVVSFLLFSSVKCCISQVALYQIRSESHSMATASLMASPPSLLNAFWVLSGSTLRFSILGFVLLVVATQGIALTSIFVPGSLTIISSPPRVKSVDVPTVDLNLVDPSISTGGLFPVGNDESNLLLVFSGASQRWQQLITRSASTDIAPTWKPPVECGLYCNYTFTYVAPALNCTTLSQQDIWPDGVANSNSSLLYFPFLSHNGDPPEYFFYNTSYSVVQGSKLGGISFNSSILEVHYVEGFNTSLVTEGFVNETFPDTSELSARGARCEFQNATYEAVTWFSNNTQSSRTRVVEWSGSLPIGPAGNGPLAGTNVTNSTLAGLSIAYTYAEFLNGNASFDLDTLETGRTQMFNTPLFNLTTTNLSISESFFSLSRNLNGDLVAGLQELLGNVTLAFVNENIATTRVDAVVVPGSVEYSYDAGRLGIVYGTVFGIALIAMTFGVRALRENRITATFTLEQILEMTASSSGLHKLAGLPTFSRTPVKGELISNNAGSTTHILDVDRERKEV